MVLSALAASPKRRPAQEPPPPWAATQISTQSSLRRGPSRSLIPWRNRRSCSSVCLFIRRANMRAGYRSASVPVHAASCHAVLIPSCLAERSPPFPAAIGTKWCLSRMIPARACLLPLHACLLSKSAFFLSLPLLHVYLLSKLGKTF